MVCEFSNKLFLFSLSAASVPGFLPILDILHFFSSSSGRLLKLHPFSLWQADYVFILILLVL